MTHPNQAPSPSDIRQEDVREALDSLLAFRRGDTKHLTKEHARILYAALSAQTGEPVAWRFRWAYPADSLWEVVPEEGMLPTNREGWIIEPLYASPQPDTAPSPLSTGEVNELDAYFNPPRMKVAAYLLARDETCVSEQVAKSMLDWAAQLLKVGAQAKHSGDCTKESHACNRCIADRAFAHADQLLALSQPPATEQIRREALRTGEMEASITEICANLVGSCKDVEDPAIAETLRRLTDLKIALRAALSPPPQPDTASNQAEANPVTVAVLAQFLHDEQPIMLGGRSQPISVYIKFSRLILLEFNIQRKVPV